MIIHDLNVVGVTVLPPKADTPPIIDPNAVLPSAVTRQLLEPVAGRESQVFYCFGGIENEQLSQGGAIETSRPSPNDLAAKESFSVPIGKVTNHI